MLRRDFLKYAVAVACLSACGAGQPKGQKVAVGGVVLALGDSLTAGYGASSAQAYPEQLAQITRWRVVNGGVSGDTSEQALARLPELLKQKPKLVLVSIGSTLR